MHRSGRLRQLQIIIFIRNMKSLFNLSFVCFLLLSCSTANDKKADSKKAETSKAISYRDSLVNAELAKGASKSKEQMGTAYPSFSFTVNNKQVTNERLKGKVVFVNFWFASCPPCRVEFEALNNLYEKFQGNDSFVFLSVTYEKPGEIERMRKENNLRFPIVSVSQEECRRLNLNNGYPTNIIIDKSGVIRNIHTGGHSSSDESNHFFVQNIYPVIEKLL